MRINPNTLESVKYTAPNRQTLMTTQPDLVLKNAELIITMTGEEIAGGWIALHGGAIHSIGRSSDPLPPAKETLDCTGGLITPGMICTHHHIYQNITRNWFADELAEGLFAWLIKLNPVWAHLDEESSYLSTWIAMAEMALGGCTTTSDHLNNHPKPFLVDAQIKAAQETGMRFHPTRGSMDLGERHGSITADACAQEIDVILEDCERLVKKYHERDPLAMTQIALAPCNPFATTTELMKASAELAEKLDVRLHTHLAESKDEEDFCIEKLGLRPMERFVDCGWDSGRTWVAHGVCLNDAELDHLGKCNCGIAHCPTSNILFNKTVGDVHKMWSKGIPVGLGVDGGSSAGHGSLYHETRLTMLAAQLRTGTPNVRAREALKLATVGGARCLGREGEIGQLSIGAAADLVVWPVDGLFFSGFQGDLVEAWLRNGPLFARHTIVNGKFLVKNGELQLPDVEEKIKAHQAISDKWWQLAQKHL